MRVFLAKKSRVLYFRECSKATIIDGPLRGGGEAAQKKHRTMIELMIEQACNKFATLEDSGSERIDSEIEARECGQFRVAVIQ
ncbi:hypothetical protein HN011_005837 [Eciton burchellii]|nr:hypothetical protein HN011_005837 [Eciton burchellii]